MELTSEIKDMKTWDEASKWLERHGWGPGLIDEQKIVWDAAKAPKSVEKEDLHKHDDGTVHSHKHTGPHTHNKKGK
jgi:hypothetical protein